MSEDTTATPATGGELPGGFGSTEAMYEALEKAKADISTHKTRAADVKAMADRLAEYEQAETARKESEMSELEKMQGKLSALESSLAEKDGAILAANRSVLLERELSKRLASWPDPVREIARDLYVAASGAGFTDETELTGLLDPVDDKLKGLQPADSGGTRVTMTGQRAPDRKPTTTAAAARDFLNLPYKEQAARLRREKGR